MSEDLPSTTEILSSEVNTVGTAGKVQSPSQVMCFPEIHSLGQEILCDYLPASPSEGIKIRYECCGLVKWKQ